LKIAGDLERSMEIGCRQNWLKKKAVEPAPEEKTSN